MSKKNTNVFIKCRFYELNFLWLLNLSVGDHSGVICNK